jgi:hypothetical protein
VRRDGYAEGEEGERGVNLHSQRSLVSRLQRDGVNMAEERRKVRVEERLKIKIGELRTLKFICFKEL